MQDDDLLGLAHGIYIGTTGILLKPLSGGLDCVAKLCTGLGGQVLALFLLTRPLSFASQGGNTEQIIHLPGSGLPVFGITSKCEGCS